MKLLSIIPARGGSKRLPNKNVMEFLGKPLVWHTIEAVHGVSNTTILTSDSDKILKVADDFHISAITTLKRDPSLAADKSTVLETVVDIVCNQGYQDFDAVGLFLPTAPLRNKWDIIDCISKLKRSKNIDGIISTTDYEFPPTLGLVKDNDQLLHCSDQSLPFINGNTRSQDHEKIIRPNGAIYIKYMDKFLRDKNFFKGRVTNFHMTREKSADIDTEADFKIAEMLYKFSQS